MHYFTTNRRLLGTLPLDPHFAPRSLDPLGDFRSQTPNLPTLEKIMRAPMCTMTYESGINCLNCMRYFVCMKFGKFYLYNFVLSLF